MKQLCTRNCQIRKDKKIIYVYAGEVLDFNEDFSHPCFTSVGKAKINFDTSSEAALLEGDWKSADAIKHAKEKWNATIKTGTKAEVVAQILDARFRNTSIPKS